MVLGAVGGGLGVVAGGRWLGGGVGVAPLASGTGISGGGVGVASVCSGIGASGADVEVAGTEVSGTALEGEERELFFFFLFSFWTGGTKGSVLPAASSSAPMLLAPVSWVSGGEVRSSSAR